MLKKFLFTVFCFALISGCALLDTSEVEVEKQDGPAPVADAEPAMTSAQGAVAATAPETPSAVNPNKSVSSESVKKIQAHLKEAGFYSGTVDGMADAGTQSAIRHFQSGCATLKDLLAGGNSTPAALPSTAVKTMAGAKRAAPDAIRVVQLRLKDAGFDPGPIDGIHGAKTQRALVALKSGCAMLKDASLATGAERAMAVNGGRPAAPLLREAPLGEPSGREAVKALQVQLRDAGFDPGPVDGIIGPRTRAALQKYNASVSRVSVLH